MEATFFIFFLLLFSFIITKISFFNKSGLSNWELVCLFTIKILAGIAYARFYKLPQYYQGSDTWRFYKLSLTETQWLLQNPVAFFKDLFVHGYSSSGNLLGVENSYWNDLKSNVPVKVMAVMNVFTNNSYYTNIILFNFLFLFGLIALFRLFNNIYPKKKYLLIAGLFLLPSTLFWCSGIHKDGLILSATGLIIYSFYSGLQTNFKLRNWVFIAFCGFLIFSLRNYVFFALIPALFSWFLSYKYPNNNLLVFASVYIIGSVLFFLLPILSDSLNFPLYISLKQQDFIQLQATSVVNLPALVPTFKGFVAFLPHALDMAFFRPHLSEIKNFSYIPAAVEVILLFGLIIFVLSSSKSNKSLSPFILFLFYFAISIFLICGYTIPFSGAIVRYRSFVFPFLITPLLGASNIFSKSN